MKQHSTKIFFAAVVLLAIFAASTFIPTHAAVTPLSGATGATAGAGGVTAGLFVKLESAGTIVTATAVTDKVVGVCDLAASANGLTRYAPIGTQRAVTSGEAITVGDLLTAGTGGKAFVLDTDDASTQRYCAVALTAASGADESVTVAIIPGVVEQRLTLGGTVAISGANTFTTGTGAVTLAGDVTVSSGKDIGMSGASTFTSGTGAIALNGDITVAAGKDISFAVGAGYLELNGETSGSIVIDPITTGTNATTIVNGNAAGPATITLPDATAQLNGAPGSSVASDADSLAIPVTNTVVTKTTGGDAEALTLANGFPGQVLIITLVTAGGGEGTLTPATKTGFATIVFADAGDTAALLYVDDSIGWIILGTAGVAAPPVISV